MEKKELKWVALAKFGTTAGLAIAMMHGEARAMVDASSICKIMVTFAAKDGADIGYKCVSHPKRKVVFVAMPPSASHVAQNTWASVKGFVRGSEKKSPGGEAGWDLVFEVSKGSCMGMSEADAAVLSAQFEKVKGGLHTKEFPIAALTKIKPVDCAMKPLARASLPKTGGRLCEAIEKASASDGDLEAAIYCRQTGETAHLEMKLPNRFLSSPKQYFSAMAAAGRVWKSAGPKARLSISMDSELNPSKCLLISFAAFDGVNKAGAQTPKESKGLSESNTLADLDPTGLGMAITMPILRALLQPELGETAPCLGFDSVEQTYTVVFLPTVNREK